MGYQVNEKFFNDWTKESAWVYGWMVTDGNIGISNGSYQIRFMVNRKDRDVVEKIKKAMDFTGKISDGQRSDGREWSYLRICRKGIVERLFELGYPKDNKTFEINYPNIPEEFEPHFLRGVFEGDGSLNVGNWDDLRAVLCGASPNFMERLKQRLTYYGVNTRMTKRKDGLITLEAKSNGDALQLCNLIYQDSTKDIRMNRKFKIFTNYISAYYDMRKRRSARCKQLVNDARRLFLEEKAV